ncbi:metal-sensitive transcriptional regulator [Lactococcus allomyrinae]|uniref:Metal-sensitive transcriptional regulator n=1 Tax=Lactococcus allomyrinae TaxID=2419773 RepID=A0A387BNK9_9LACT|nr:metal-sensitive transcriptional regulator [Lactococcus allomyrinae]AYG00101.1 metal-sensitive transcriptional regulator [Lactococcus allomyrinae]
MNNYDKKMTNRLKRADGQLQGVLRMMQEEKDCIDIVTQLTAVRSSLDNLIGLIVAENLKTCLLSETAEKKEDKIEQAIKMIIKK